MTWEHEGSFVGDDYLKFCLIAIASPKLMNAFKTNPAYTRVLSCVPPDEGTSYLKKIRERYPDLLDGPYRENDRLGGPALATFEGIDDAVDPNTIRYLKQVGDIRKLFGDDLPTIAEIGGGYGGLCLLIKRYLRNARYKIFDHPLVEPFSRAYLAKHDVLLWDDLQEYDLVISNWAWDELTRDERQLYIDRVFTRARRGYLTARPRVVEENDWGLRPYSMGEMEGFGEHYIFTWDDTKKVPRVRFAAAAGQGVLLEIGNGDGREIAALEAAIKIRVSPYEPTPLVNSLHKAKKIRNFKMSSDDFFDSYDRLIARGTLDTVILDGTKTHEQSRKDLANALGRLSPGGTVIMRGCNPEKLEHTQGLDDPRRTPPWAGDVWKTVVEARATHRGISVRVEGSNAVIKKESSTAAEGLPQRDFYKLRFEDLEKNRSAWLGLDAHL